MLSERRIDSPSIMRRPVLLLVFGIAAIIAGFLLSTAIFPDLGPSQARLTSDDPAVRRVAEVTVIEIMLFRGALFVGGAVFIVVWAFWHRIAVLPAVHSVQSRVPYPLYRPAFANQGLAVMLAAAALFFVWIGIGGVYPPAFPRFIGLEDGPIEYATAILFGIASVLMAVAGFRQSGLRKMICFLMAAGFLLCMIEEVSWGQRILEYNTPEPMTVINAQSEFNIHNSFGYAADHLFILAVILYGVALPFLCYYYKFFHKAIDFTGIPIPSLGLAVGFAVASMFHDWTIYAVLPKVPLNVAEVREFLSALGLALLCVETMRVRQKTSR